MELKSYIGTKIVLAEPCNKEDMPNLPQVVGEKLTSKTPGYKVVYEDGYQSWSPADVFERSYRLITDKEKDLISK